MRKPPAASLLTAPVVLTHARTTVVLRGTLTDGGAISVGVPGDLSGDLPVVTAVATAPGAHVADGSLIAAVAGRPVFVMQGRIPAYSMMGYGSTGVEVTELQAGLEAAGSRPVPTRPAPTAPGRRRRSPTCISGSATRR